MFVRRNNSIKASKIVYLEKLMCECISYNRPDLSGGKFRNLSLPAPGWSSKECISVDPCIAPIIQCLWNNDIITRGSCCGHNKVFSRYIQADDTEGSRVKTYYKIKRLLKELDENNFLIAVHKE